MTSADERNAAWQEGYLAGQTDTLADLRAKVEALPKAVYQWDSDYISRAAVIALIDGSGDA